jgi:hypothetical protein
MDWQALHDGLRAWFSDASGIPVESVTWAGDPVGMRKYPWAELQLQSSATESSVDEVRYTKQGADLAVTVVGNRRITLTCQIHSRDQRAAYRAYALLERVRGRLYFPATATGFRQLGVGVRESAALVDLGRAYDNRDESVASLDVLLNWVSIESDTDNPVGTIERVTLSGTVNGAIAIPDKDIP